MSSFLWYIILASCFIYLGSCNPSLLVIGAGPAGIAAVTRLFENGFSNITILEAENRIGGRVHSVAFGDAFVDVGAEFCHGEKDNIVYDMVKNLNILEHYPLNSYQGFEIYYSNGSRISKPLEKDLLEAFDYIFENNENSENINVTKGISSGQYFIDKYNSVVGKKYEGDKQNLKLLKEGLHMAETWARSLDGSFSWLEVSHDSHYKHCEGDQLLTWNGRGYKTVLEVMLKTYPDPSKKLNVEEKLILNKTVTKIDWASKNDKVLVTCTDGSLFTADHVIFTPSVGVLKANHLKMFQPALSAAKQKAIDEVGFDGVMKIIMHFPQKWWGDKDDIFFMWSEEDLKTSAAEFPYGPTVDGKSWISEIGNIGASSRNPNVRIIWVTGSVIGEVEQLPLEVIKNGVVHVLNKFLGKHYNISAPDQIMTSTWRSNPNFRGTYSYEKVKYYKEEVSNQDILAEPLTGASGKPTVLFAGEATHPTHYSTVHGAIETGYREADRLIKLYKN